MAALDHTHFGSETARIMTGNPIEVRAHKQTLMVPPLLAKGYFSITSGNIIDDMIMCHLDEY